MGGCHCCWRTRAEEEAEVFSPRTPTPAEDHPTPRGTVVVTGASGFLGAHVIKAALEAGYEVRGTMRNVAERGPAMTKVFPNSKVEFVEGDVADLEQITQAVAGCTYVIHVAQPLGADVWAATRDCWQNVLEASNRVGTVKRVVFTSTVGACVFGADGTFKYGSADDPVNEDDWTCCDEAFVQEMVSKQGPFGGYSPANAKAEIDGFAYVKEKNPAFDVVSVAPCMIHGLIVPGMEEVNPGAEMHGWYGWLLNALIGTGTVCLAKMNLGVPNDDCYIKGAFTMQPLCGAIIDVEDCAKLHVAVLARPECANRRYLLGSSPDCCAVEVDKLLRDDPVIGPYVKNIKPVGDDGTRGFTSNERLSKELGFKTKPWQEPFLAMAHDMHKRGLLEKKDAQ